MAKTQFLKFGLASLLLLALLSSFVSAVECSVWQCKADIDLVLDKSLSMNNLLDGETKFDSLKSIAIPYIEAMLDPAWPELENFLGATLFDHDIRASADLTTNSSVLVSIIDSTTPFGATNYIDSITSSVDKLIYQGRADAPDFILFLSDGLPNVLNSTDTSYSIESQDMASAIEAANYAADNNITLYTIGFGNEGDFDPALLEEMASIAGGNSYSASDANALNAVFNSVLEEICVCLEYEPICGDSLLEEGEQCDDGNLINGDGCSSICEIEDNEEINCTINLDCGISGPLDGNFCHGKNVSQTLVTYTCNNAGTLESFCSEVRETQTLQTCDDFCAFTEEVPIAHCEEFVCESDLDCGTDGYIGVPYCSVGDVFQNYTDYTCVNPATNSSLCTNQTSERLKVICSDESICTNGQCVEEDDDGDNGDNDDEIGKNKRSGITTVFDLEERTPRGSEGPQFTVKNYQITSHDNYDNKINSISQKDKIADNKNFLGSLINNQLDKFNINSTKVLWALVILSIVLILLIVISLFARKN